MAPEDYDFQAVPEARGYYRRIHGEYLVIVNYNLMWSFTIWRGSKCVIGRRNLDWEAWHAAGAADLALELLDTFYKMEE